MKKVVITGCTGAIGRALINKCLSEGDMVIALVRPGSNRNNLISENENVKIIECDLDNLSSINVNVTADIFFHLGWSGVNRQLRNNPNIQIKNIQYTMDAINLAKKLECTKFVGAGSQAEYGPKSELITEKTSTNPITGYGIGKYAAGMFGKLYAEELGIDFNWTRIFSVYGPNDGEDSIIPSTIKKMKNNEPLDYYSDCTHLWEFIYADDCANALYLVGQKGISGKTYNISSGNSKELKEYVNIIKKILGSSSIITYSQNKSNNNLNTDISLLQSDTGFNTNVSFEDGIKKLL